MGRTLVLGDVHGAKRALDQVLERCQFDNENDRIIFLGDWCDGWPESKEVAQTLVGIRDIVLIEGNHDTWAFDWARTGLTEHLWYIQGGKETKESFDNKAPEWLSEFADRFVKIHVEDGRCYVHGGIPMPRWRSTVGEIIWGTTLNSLSWDRSLFEEAMGKFVLADTEPIVDAFEEVYVGHTTTGGVALAPCRGGNVWMMDQGAGWGGVLSIMDVETKDYWTSDIVSKLYPDVKGRG